MIRFHSKTVATLTGLVSAFLVSSAKAETEGAWYVGVDIGAVRIVLDSNSSVEGKNMSDRSVAVHGGYRFSRHFAIESTYANLGDYSYTLRCPEICVPENYPRAVKTSGDRLDLSLVGSIPLGERLEAYARFGVATTGSTTTARALNREFQSKRSDVSALYGVGVRVLFEGPWSLRLQWERGRYPEDFNVRNDGLWLGAEYRFGERRI